MSFVRIGNDSPKEYSVRVLFDNGIEVTRRKGKEVNEYKLSEEGGEEKVFSAVKLDVPKQIKDSMRICEVSVDGSTSVNIQFCSQFDGPFVMAESGPAKIKFLNMLSGTSAVDLALKDANSEVAKSKKEIDNTALEITKCDLVNKDLSTKIDAIETANKFLATNYAELKELQDTKKTFTEMQTDTADLKESFAEINRLDSIFNGIDFDSLSDKINKLIALIKLKTEYDKLHAKYKKLLLEEKLYNKVNVEEVSEKIEKLLLTWDLNSKYNTLKDKFIDNKNSCADVNSDILAKKDKYINGIKELQICPVCKSTITDDILTHISEAI